MSTAPIAQGPVDVLVGRLRAHAEAHEYIANADEGQRQWMHDLYDAADALERAPRWRDVAEELPQEAQEVLFVRDGKTVHGAWIGGIFWHSNQKMAAAIWMPLPVPPNRGDKMNTLATKVKLRNMTDDELIIEAVNARSLTALEYELTTRFAHNVKAYRELKDRVRAFCDDFPD